MRKIVFTLSALLLLFCLPAQAGKGKVVLASLYWPPYAGEGLPGGGSAVRIVREAFRMAGYELEVRYFPWNRVMFEAESNPEIDGYFPEYRGRASRCLYSDSIGRSPLGFAKLRTHKLPWNEIAEIGAGAQVVGVVDGYLNSVEFDELARKKIIRTETAVSDRLNLRKVLMERIDLAVIDLNVFRYLAETDPVIHSRKEELDFMPRMLAIHNLYVCFEREPRGAALKELFNKGLRLVGTGGAPTD
ncbi:ABC transporter [Pseudodesulfovibrio cashew]|uniref:ABC transporter n=1 Tax=Pseudodesulfovibrio cashew TaxID=2678688 RepID=A0A6I6JFY5_9BACT|nr:ABC transporter [Pseudodesulfovibrio cashew]QGY41746.1 ABC transporter [Pseudodesulfovibrio cashew]